MNIENKILETLKKHKEDITTSSIASESGIDRHTAAKYLQVLQSQGFIESRNIGKSKVWKISENQFVTALKGNNNISGNIKQILNSLDSNITIRTPNSLLWTNHKDCCTTKDKCEECYVDKTFKSGKPESGIKTWNKKKVKITTKPIKNQNNDTIAVVEIVKNLK